MKVFLHLLFITAPMIVASGCGTEASNTTLAATTTGEGGSNDASPDLGEGESDSLTIVGIYGAGVVELSNGALREVVLSCPFVDWSVGDSVALDSTGLITNLDTGTTTLGSYLGDAVAHTTVVQVYDAGRFIDLANAAWASWEIANPTYQAWARAWSPGQRVVVVLGPFSFETGQTFLLVREQTECTATKFVVAFPM